MHLSHPQQGACHTFLPKHERYQRSERHTSACQRRRERGHIMPKVMHDRAELDLPLNLSRKAGRAMTAWTRGGRTASSPSRLARSAPPLHGCGLDRLSSARQGLSKRSWLKVSGVAPIAKALPLSVRSVPWRRNRSFRLRAFHATLAQCPALAHCAAAAPNAVCSPTISSSSLALGRASGGHPSTTLRSGASSTTGPRACRSRRPRLMCSRRGSATPSMNCSGPADDLRRQSR